MRLSALGGLVAIFLEGCPRVYTLFSMVNNLKEKKIILAVSGSIAAYKAAFLCRLLIKAGAEVQVIMTPAATQFISALSLSTLSKRPVYTDVI